MTDLKTENRYRKREKSGIEDLNIPDELQDNPADLAAETEAWENKRAQYRRMVNQIRHLTEPKEREMLLMRFGLGRYKEGPRTLKEAGKAIGVTKQGANYIEQRALKKIRSLNGVGDEPPEINGNGHSEINNDSPGVSVKIIRRRFQKNSEIEQPQNQR